MTAPTTAPSTTTPSTTTPSTTAPSTTAPSTTASRAPAQRTTAPTASAGRTHAVVDTELGPVTVVGSDGALAGVYLHGQRHLPPPSSLGPRDDRTLPELQEQLQAYLAGDLQEFDVELAPLGTAFQAEVWAALRRVPYGTTTTYGALAAAVGRPTAVRAVGAANGRNPYCLVVPCHRVVGADGSLTGYAGGLERKRFLLDLEAGRATLERLVLEPPLLEPRASGRPTR